MKFIEQYTCLPQDMNIMTMIYKNTYKNNGSAWRGKKMILQNSNTLLNSQGSEKQELAINSEMSCLYYS